MVFVSCRRNQEQERITTREDDLDSFRRFPDFVVVGLVDDDSRNWPDDVGPPLERVVASPVSQTIDGDGAWPVSESHMAWQRNCSAWYK
jgi:hypothetical protein